MDAITGYRTFIAMFVSGTLAPWITTHAPTLALTPGQQAWVVGLAVAGVGIVMRLFTKTPPTKAVPEAVADAHATLVAAAVQKQLVPADKANIAAAAVGAAKVVLLALLMVPLAAGLAACTSAQVASASNTCRTAVRDGAAANNLVVTTATTAVASGLLSPDQVPKILAVTDSAQAALTVAAAACAAGDAAATQMNLTAASAKTTAVKACVPTAAGVPGAAVDACLAGVH